MKGISMRAAALVAIVGIVASSGCATGTGRGSSSGGQSGSSPGGGGEYRENQPPRRDPGMDTFSRSGTDRTADVERRRDNGSSTDTGTRRGAAGAARGNTGSGTSTGRDVGTGSGGAGGSFGSYTSGSSTSPHDMRTPRPHGAPM